jgi:NAD(P)H-nitrite reductase large subunit
MGMCGADPVTIIEGLDNISPPEDDEIITLERLGSGPRTRLACCAKVSGDVKLTLGLEKASKAIKVNTEFAVDISVKRVVIIGNGIAGVTAADHIRRHHKNCEIHIVGRETHPLYNRMGISRLIYGRSAMQGLYLLPESWYREHKIIPWLNTHAVAINFDAHTVRLGTGEELAYDRLILAMGSQSRIPRGLQGFGIKGSFVLHKADDAMEMRSYIQQYASTRAVVAGGGVLGLEAAYALHQLGLHVTILESSEYLMPRQLDRRSSELLQIYIERMGIDVFRQTEIIAIHGQERVEKIELRNRRTIDCGIILLAAGVYPDLELLKGSDLDIDRGVKVDRHMRTRRPEVFAAGDIAELEQGFVYGVWPVAVDQGRIAGLNAIGDKISYSGQPPLISLKVLGIELISIGIVEAVGADIFEIVLEEESEHRYRKLVIRGINIIGAILLGYPEYVDVVKKAIHDVWDIS